MNTPTLYQMYFETPEYRQIDTKYIKYTDFEIHFSFFRRSIILQKPCSCAVTEMILFIEKAFYAFQKIPKKLSGTEVQFVREQAYPL